MVGGTIVDFFEEFLNNDVSTVEFLVKEKEGENTCTVRAEVPKVTLDFLAVGQQIWWHTPLVRIELNDSTEISFSKVGFSSGDSSSFYAKKSAADGKD